MGLIYQRGEYDCFVAAIAMAAELPYENVYDRFRSYVNKQAVPAIQTIIGWLQDQGFRIETSRSLAPFAPSHIAKVRWRSPHFVAMTQNGEVQDPYKPYPAEGDWPAYLGNHFKLTHPDFEEVFWVMGLWR